MSYDPKDAKERHEDAKGAMAHIHTQMQEDFRFSDPSNPMQWDPRVRSIREGDHRPCMVFDQTNQYIRQVVNDGRQNKPSIKVRGVSGDADVKAAEALQGIIYHIEDTSRASIAYDTALDHAARAGIGWIRITTEIIDPRLKLKDLRIKRVHNPFSVVLENWTEPDGSDALAGWIEQKLTASQFRMMYPDSDVYKVKGEYVGDDWVMVCDEYLIDETDEAHYEVMSPDGRGTMDLSEDDYAALVTQMGQEVPYLRKYSKTVRRQTWSKRCGDELVEDPTTFAADFVPLVPVIGNESYDRDGKRWLCGMVRQMMDPARAYNYERSSYIERVALSSKAPWIGPEAAFEGYDEWDTANSQNHSRLRYNHMDDAGQTIPAPTRPGSPDVPTAFIQGAQMARDDLQASIGMYRSNLGAPSNAVSGRAKMQDQREGDTATFHYIDNLGISIGQVGRICLQAIPAYYDTKRAQRILGEDGTSSQIIIDPSSESAAKITQPPQVPGQQQPKPQIVLNPTIGEYDVSVSTGPAYSTKRQETADKLSVLTQGNPQLFALVGDVLAKMEDWPEADKIAARLHAMLPPQVLAAENQDDPQQAQMQQHIQQLTQGLQQAQQQVQQMGEQLKAKQDDQRMKNQLEQGKVALDAQRLKLDEYEAITARLSALTPSDPAIAAAIYQSVVAQALGIPPGQPVTVPVPQPVVPQHLQPPPGPPGGQQQTQGPSGPFSLPAQGAQGPSLQ